MARLSDPRRKTVRDAKVRHLLSGAARCAVCGSRMRAQPNRTHLAYLCVENFCVSSETKRLDDFVLELLLQRLEREDVLDLFTPPEAEASVAAARQELAELEERLQGFYATAAAGKLTPAGLAAIEERLLPDIANARRRAQPSAVPKVLQGLPGPGVRQRWKGLEIGLQREVVSLLVDLRVGKTYRGARRLDPWRLADSRWRGSQETWGQIWKRERRTPAPR